MIACHNEIGWQKIWSIRMVIEFHMGIRWVRNPTVECVAYDRSEVQLLMDTYENQTASKCMPHNCGEYIL